MPTTQDPYIKVITADFIHYDKAMLAEYIAVQETDTFDIIISRYNYDYIPDDGAWLADEFILCGYAGELLSRTVKKFAYNVPYAFSTDSVIFRVTVEDFDAFNETLYRLVRCAINDGEYIEEHNEFYMEAGAMYEQFTEGGVSNAIGLFATAYVLLNPDIVVDEEDEEGDDE